MNVETRALVIFIAVIAALGFGIFWGVDAVPKEKEFMESVKSATKFYGASAKLDDRMIFIKGEDMETIFNLIRSAPEYSPNHPAVMQKGEIHFSTNAGRISMGILVTSDQGILVSLNSSGNTGWHFGYRRCDELRPYLDDRAKTQKEVSPDIQGASSPDEKLSNQIGVGRE